MDEDKLSYYFDKIKDALMFREGSFEDNYTTEPKVTLGSIIWGILLRTGLIIGAVMLIEILFFKRINVNWYIVFFLMWVFVAFPAYRQYRKFDERIDDLEESTLCGSCRYFIKDSQLCRLYDEHISIDFIPCEGESWEPGGPD